MMDKEYAVIVQEGLVVISCKYLCMMDKDNFLLEIRKRM